VNKKTGWEPTASKKGIGGKGNIKGGTCRVFNVSTEKWSWGERKCRGKFDDNGN